jgi:hypothetical protein
MAHDRGSVCLHSSILRAVPKLPIGYTTTEIANEAVKAHNDYTREASLGHGVDRHLMGLRLVMKKRVLATLRR